MLKNKIYIIYNHHQNYIAFFITMQVRKSDVGLLSLRTKLFKSITVEMVIEANKFLKIMKAIKKVDFYATFQQMKVILHHFIMLN